MTEISDLKRRVDAVGEKFGRLAEQESRYGERLAGLLSAVEQGFARSQQETQALKNELAGARDELTKLMGDLEAARDEARRHRGELDEIKAERETLTSQLDGAKDESRQLRGMLLTLLEAVETGGQLDIGAAMRKLESRIDRIVTSSDDGSAPTPAQGEPAGAEDDTLMLSAATQATSEPPAPEAPAPEAPAPESLVPESLAPESPEAFDLVDIEPDDDELDLDKDALDLDEAGVDLSDVVEEVTALASEMPAPDDSGEDGDVAVPDVPEEPEQPRKLAAVTGKSTEPPSDDDLSAVNKIIQRISLLTGEFVEPTHKRTDSDPETTAPSLEIGNDPDEGDSPDDESAAKTK
jgi:ABC-type transporter Mla subunit MlaD